MAGIVIGGVDRGMLWARLRGGLMPHLLWCQAVKRTNCVCILRNASSEVIACRGEDA